MRYFHEPVLLKEVLEYLNPRPGQNFVDCTLGGGGHTLEILKKVAPNGKVLGIDLDPAAITAAKDRAQEISLKNNLILVQDNFKNFKKIIEQAGFKKVDGILLDLGLSSAQLNDHQRGFSFLAEGNLDMRFGPGLDTPAAKILNHWSEEELYEIFNNFGEERLAKPIAQAIVAARKQNSFQVPRQLVELIVPIYKKYYHKQSRINPATKIFQALRIAVNRELDNLIAVLPQAVNLLAEGGRIAVISYHSLEDRIVKNYFRNESKACLCPPTMPVCQCQHKKTLKIITPKPIEPSSDEVILNPRSRSAKLRVAEKIKNYKK